MSVEIKKRFGTTISLYLDGHGYESGLDIICENGTETAHQCPFAMAEIMPMVEVERPMKQEVSFDM